MADKNLDEYKPLKFYKTHTKSRQNGFAKFKEDGSHYFALYKDGDIVMLSQAYVNESGRDNGIESVKKNSKLKKRYVFDTRSGGKHGFGLKAGNGQEIAISPNYASKSVAEHAAGRLNGSVRAAREVAAPKTTRAKALPKKAAPKKVVKAKAPRKANDEDDYRRLAFYNRQTKGRKNGIESFKGDDGNYYFAHFENSKIRLISESYPTKTARDTGAASVQKNIKLPKRYDYRGPLKNGKYDYRLKAGNGKEIARSIWYGSAAAAATGAAYLMGTRKRTAPKPRVAKPKVAPIVAAAAVATAVPVMAKAVKPVAKPVAKPVVKPVAPPVVAAAIPAAPAAVVPAAAATSGFGWGWMKWLLPLLLLLLLLLGLKYCKPKAVVVPPALITCWDNSEAESQALCPKKVSCWDGSFVKNASSCPVEPPKMISCWDGSEAESLTACPVEPAPEPVIVKKAPTPAPKVTANMNRLCSSSDNVLFNVSSYATPVSVGRLGTFPEFGDSHGLTPTEFYNKLANRFAASDFDRKYLNYVAKSLGYAGGFSDMSAADFSSETLAQGTKGLLGFGEFHGLKYSQLNVSSSRDLEAFRIRAANGTDVHFMKTCGNYMYVCN